MATLGLLQGGTDFRHLNFHIDPNVGGHCLDHFGDPLPFRACRHHQVNIEALLDPGVCHQRSCSVEIARRDGQSRVVIGVTRMKPLVTGDEFAIEDDLVEGFTIDGQT